MGFLSESLRDVITILSLLATIGGFWWAIAQVYKTKGAAEASRNAISKTERVIQANVAMIEVAKLVQTINHIRDYLRADDLRTALLLIREVRTGIARIQAIKRDDRKLCKVLSARNIMIAEADYTIERRIGDQTAAFDSLAISKKLAELVDTLNEAFGSASLKT